MEYRQHLTEQEKNYDKLCGITLTNIFTLSKTNQTIAFKYFDSKNSEHLYVLSIGIALADIVNKSVSIVASKRTIRQLNKKFGRKAKELKIIATPAADIEKAIAPQIIVDDLREEGKKLCGDNFTFSDIFNEFYERNKK